MSRNSQARARDLRRWGLGLVLLGLYSLGGLLSILGGGLQSKSGEARQRSDQFLIRSLDSAEPGLEQLVKRIEDYRQSRPSGLSSGVDPFAHVADRSQVAWKAEREEPIGRIQLPRIGVDLPIYIGATEEHLSQGFASVDGGELPLGLQGGHAVLACHRVSRLNTLLMHINEMQPGDHVYIEVWGKRMCYQLEEMHLIQNYQWSAFAPVEGQDLVSLVTCPHYLYTTERQVLRCRRIPWPQKPGARQDSVLDFLKKDKASKIADIQEGGQALAADKQRQARSSWAYQQPLICLALGLGILLLALVLSALCLIRKLRRRGLP